MKRFVVIAALLSLSMPVDAGKSKKKEPPAETAAASEDARPMPTMEERNAVFGQIDADYLNGQKARAADGLVEVVANPEHSTFHAEAWARLGGILEELDLPFSALCAYERALSIDAEGVSSVAKKAIALADRVGDHAMLEPVFAKNVGLDVDDATRSRMAYLAAREAHRKEAYGKASALLKMVQPTDPNFPEAKSLEGVTTALQGRPDDALAPLLTALAAGEKAGRDQRFIDVVNLNLGRSYFAAGNFPRAIEYYAKVSRGSLYWPEAQFERAWAHFRIDDMNGALGLLMTHDSPFFGDWFFPEGELLRIYALVLMCKFPEASRMIDEFQARYKPLQHELNAIAALPPEELFVQMRNWTDHGKTELPRIISRKFEHEDHFKGSLTAIRYAEDELTRLKNVAANPFSEAATEWVTQRRQELIELEGTRVQDRVFAMQQQLSGMLTDSDISKLDIMGMETKLYEQASVTGRMAEARRTVDRTARVKKGYQGWDWEGEYWADEVGYYKVTAKPDCPTSLQAPQQQ